MAKVWKVPSKQVSHLPLPKSTDTERKFYSLYQKIDGRWNRIRVEAFPADFAVKVWSSRVCSDPFNYSIRKANVELDEAR
jgi:hypothetical protein